MTPDTSPNVIVILADDLGFSDLACYGGEIPTPNIDRLARRGVRMSSFYTTPRCSPTRASLMTGRYSHEVGIGVLTRPVGYRGSIDPEVPTIATILEERGYATGLSGKWHLSAEVREPSSSWPTRRGFQDFYGILGGGTSYFNPQAFYDGEAPVAIDAGEEDFYLTDALTSRGVEFMSRAQHRGQPFFLYLAYTAPHWPLHATEEDEEARRGAYADGWDAARTRRHERQRELGLFPQPVALSERDAGEAAWSETEHPEWQQRRMEVFAAQVVALDRGVGRVLDHLERTGVLDDTLVLFLSDNGAEAEELQVDRWLAPHVTPDRTRAGEPVAIGNDPSIDPGREDTFTSYGRPWANLSNTPFRLYKKWVHEGGIAAPLIAHWPGGGVLNGGIQHDPQHVIDVLPTVLDAVGARAAEELPGRSLLPALRGVSSEEERALFWEHIGNAAVRCGRYKLVREVGREWELYDLEEDRSEQRDIAAEHPDLVGELEAEWQAWADSHGVIPWPQLVEMFEERGFPAWQARS